MPISKLFIDPLLTVSNTGVNSGYLFVTASNSPSHNPHLEVSGEVSFVAAHQGRASVPLASVVAGHFVASTHEGRVQPKVLAKSSFSELSFALRVIDVGNTDFLQNVLKFAFLPEIVLTPASDKAGRGFEVLVMFGKTYCVYVGAQGDGFFQKKHCEVIVQIVAVEKGMRAHFENIRVHVGVGLVCSLSVPFSKSNLKNSFQIKFAYTGIAKFRHKILLSRYKQQDTSNFQDT